MFITFTFSARLMVKNLAPKENSFHETCLTITLFVRCDELFTCATKLRAVLRCEQGKFFSVTSAQNIQLNEMKRFTHIADL